MIKIDDEIGYWGITAKDFSRKIGEADGDLKILIDSPGGDVFEGVQIHNAIRGYDRGEVTIIINSVAASIASYIAMAGDRIVARPNSTMMIHNVWTFAAGDHNDLRKSADVAEGLTHLLADEYAAVTGTGLDEILSMMDYETWMFGEEITQGGFAHEMEDVEESGERKALVAMATERFRACRRHVREKLEEPPLEQMAALLARRREAPAVAISREMLARRFKLTTGEDI